MPRKRKAGRVRRGYNSGDRVVLKYGVDFFNDANLDPKDIGACKEAWRDLGPDIMSRWEAEEHRKPGERPYGFWLERGFDRRLNGMEQREYLEQNGLLTSTEQAALEERDRRYSDLPNHPDDWLHEHGIRRLRKNDGPRAAERNGREGGMATLECAGEPEK